MSFHSTSCCMRTESCDTKWKTFNAVRENCQCNKWKSANAIIENYLKILTCKQNYHTSNVALLSVTDVTHMSRTGCFIFRMSIFFMFSLHPLGRCLVFSSCTWDNWSVTGIKMSIFFWRSERMIHGGLLLQMLAGITQRKRNKTSNTHLHHTVMPSELGNHIHSGLKKSVEYRVQSWNRIRWLQHQFQTD